MPGKIKVVMSDLHLGAGQGNPLEDFTMDAEFGRFLEYYCKESNKHDLEVELVLNGDCFEFLQVPAVRDFDPEQVYPKDLYHDSSEEASVKRMELIIKGHPSFFDSLADFIQVKNPQRRLTIVKGNHDVNLYWEGVKGKIRDTLGATGQRASLLTFAECYINREGVYIEHGHQRGEALNKFAVPFDDPRDPKDPSQLFYPPGSKFVIDFLNDLERERWWVDGVKPLTSLAWYGLEYDFSFSARMISRFVTNIPSILMRSFGVEEDFEENVGVGVNADVNIGANADANVKPSNDICVQLEDPAVRRDINRRYAEDPDFRCDFHRRIQSCIGQATSVGSSSFISLAGEDSEIHDSPLDMARQDVQRIGKGLHRAADDIAGRRGAKVVIFGHTHIPKALPLIKGDSYLNTGTWLWSEDFSKVSSDVWEGLFTAPDSLKMNNRLTYALINYDRGGNPRAQLRDFMTGEVLGTSYTDTPGSFFARLRSWIAGMVGLGDR